MTNILCENRRFRKVIKDKRIIGDFSYYIDLTDLDLWPWPLTFDLDLHLFCKKKLQKRNVVTSRDAKRRLAYKQGNHFLIGISSRINFQSTRSLYDFRFKSYGCYDDFHGLLCVRPWFWHFKIIWFLWIHHVPMHDWCTFRRDMFINSGDIAHWNIENSLCFIMGIFRCHGNVCYVFRIDAFFCKVHRIDPSNMYINFEKNRLKIDDFRSRFSFFMNSTVSQW